MKRILKKISSYFQTSKESFRRHNSEYEEPGKLDKERQIAERYRREDIFNSEEFKLGKLLSAYPNIRTVAVDIGSGTGWLSAELSKKFHRVVAIEPSDAANNISKSLYPVTKFPNIESRQGFAEQVLPRLSINSPALFVTGVVLSHLRDQEVKKICGWLNDKAPRGSILGFVECWGSDWHQLRWHIRTEIWWQKQLTNWRLSFHGPEMRREQVYHLGFHGEKIK